MPTDLARFAFVFAVLPSLVACREPLQNGGVIIFGGMDERISAMCRFRRDSEGKEGFCAPDVEAPKPVAITRAESGDRKLDNGEITIVVGGPKSVSYGGLVSATFTSAGENELERVTTCFGAPLGCLATSELLEGTNPDGSAWIAATGKTQGDSRINVVTRYLIAPGSRVVLMTTKITSQVTEPVIASALGDVSRFRGAEEFVQTKEVVGDVEKGAFVAAIGRGVAYAIAPFGKQLTLEVTRDAEGTMARQGRDVTLLPDKPVLFERFFVVSPRADTLGLRTELGLAAEGVQPGAIEARFVDAEGKPQKPPSGARLRFLSTDDSPSVFAFWQLDAEAIEAVQAAEAPPGHYELDLAATGFQALGRAAVDVRSGEVTKVTLAIGPEVKAAAP